MKFESLLLKFEEAMTPSVLGESFFFNRPHTQLFPFACRVTSLPTFEMQMGLTRNKECDEMRRKILKEETNDQNTDNELG